MKPQKKYLKIQCLRDNDTEDYIDNKNDNYDEFITDLMKQKNTKRKTHVKLLQDSLFTMNQNEKIISFSKK